MKKIIGMNIVVIDGKEVELKTLPTEERKKLAEEWNRRALESIGYRRVDTAQAVLSWTSRKEVKSMTKEHERMLEIDRLCRKRALQLKRTLDAIEWFMAGIVVALFLFGHCWA